MIFSFQQIQTTISSLVHEGYVGWKPGKRGDSMAAGTIINGCYQIVESVEQDGTRDLYSITPVQDGGICPLCHLKGEETKSLFCSHCGARLRGKIFQMEAFPGQIDPELIQKLLGIFHPGIAQIYDSFSIGSNTYVVSESIEGVRLDRLEGGLTAGQIRRFGDCLTQTVEFLHAQGIYRMNIQPLNLKLVGDRPRFISLSACRLKSNLPRKEHERVDRQDFRRLLETLEKLAAEYLDEDQDDMLCRLLVALEEMIGKEALSARNIQEGLNLMESNSCGEALPYRELSPVSHEPIGQCQMPKSKCQRKPQ